ncbi:hypothetical protein M2162_009007 [Streptomyces sp. SAI-041]|nr:hypothetical protein [Streptomyces sp. SAI-041]
MVRGKRIGVPIARWGVSTDRLDSEHLTVSVHDGYERFDGRSSSAAKKADAAFKFSFACRSSALSGLNRLISAGSSLRLG